MSTPASRAEAKTVVSVAVGFLLTVALFSTLLLGWLALLVLGSVVVATTVALVMLEHTGWVGAPPSSVRPFAYDPGAS